MLTGPSLNTSAAKRPALRSTPWHFANYGFCFSASGSRSQTTVKCAPSKSPRLPMANENRMRRCVC